MYELLQFPIDTTTTTSSNIAVENNNNDDVTNNKSFPVMLPNPCRIVLFSPIWIVTAPDLCGVEPKYETIVQFRTITAYQQIHYPIAIMVVPPGSGDARTTGNNTNNNCTIQEMVSNIEQINLVVIGYNEINYLILPDTYQYWNNDNNSENTTTTSSNTNNNKNNTTNQTKSVNDTNLYSNDTICTMHMDDDGIIELNNKVLQWQNQYNNTPIWQYVMMVSIDTNTDGIITVDDYNTFYGLPSDDTSEPKITTATTATTTTTATSIKTWILLAFVAFCILLFWMFRYTRRDRELDEIIEYYRQQRLNNATTTDDTNTNAVRGEADKNGTIIITEEEFAALPRITYRTSNYNPTQPENLDDILDDNNTAVKSTSLHTPMKSACKFDDTGIEPTSKESNDATSDSNNNSDTTTVRTEEQINEQRSLDVECNCEDVFSNNKNNDSWSLRRSDCCCICLEEFIDEENVLSLPRCYHLFHPQCIGEWLVVRQSDTCPLCKTTILPCTSG